MANDYGVTAVTAEPDDLSSVHPAISMPVTLKSGVAEITLPRGTVLATTDGSKFVGYDPDVSTGQASRILADTVVVPSSGDAKANSYVHGDFLIKGLKWTHTGITDNEKATAVASLFSAGIFIKER